MKKQIQIEGENIILASLQKEEIQTLRLAKNRNKKYFFNKNDISEQEQIDWFNSLEKKTDDHMLVCRRKEDQKIFGCIGFRTMIPILDGYSSKHIIDGYNIMRLENIDGTSMKVSMNLLIDWVSVQYPGLEFQVRVLEDNPAISWYESLGFEKRKKLENYWILVHKK
ncbi:hypothetical protein EBU71_15765 [bacterium]|nr:hypothetical protein [Candidatus Elulimicrobium humile]